MRVLLYWHYKLAIIGLNASRGTTACSFLIRCNISMFIVYFVCARDENCPIFVCRTDSSGAGWASAAGLVGPGCPYVSGEASFSSDYPRSSKRPKSAPAGCTWSSWQLKQQQHIRECAAMGNLRSTPLKDKDTHNHEGRGLLSGLTGMQGLRRTMEVRFSCSQHLTHILAGRSHGCPRASQVKMLYVRCFRWTCGL